MQAGSSISRERGFSSTHSRSIHSLICNSGVCFPLQINGSNVPLIDPQLHKATANSAFRDNSPGFAYQDLRVKCCISVDVK